jgi:4-hydroxymandelate oxidase
VIVSPDAAELERRARALLRPRVYDYYAGGSGREATLRANEKAWRRVWLRPRIFRDVSVVDTAVELPSGGVGRLRTPPLRTPPLRTPPLRTPLAVAPTAYHGLAHPDGELATAAGAARAGALYVLSTRSSRRIEDVAAAMSDAGGAWWFQVYLMRDRDLTAGLVRRAAAAGARALVLTADTPVVGRKREHGDDLVTDSDFQVNLGPLGDRYAAQPADDLTFADIGWLAEVGRGLPVVVKGVLRADDAAECMAHGAAGVIVSNHGGRQLDGALPTAWALPEVAAAVTEHPPGSVSVDGGVRTGEDALAALALGARLVFLGRPVLWALTCGGADGVQALLDGLTNDLAYAMAQAGASRLADLADLAGLAGLAFPAFPAHPVTQTRPPLPGTSPGHTVE